MALRQKCAGLLEGIWYIWLGVRDPEGSSRGEQQHRRRMFFERLLWLSLAAVLTRADDNSSDHRVKPTVVPILSFENIHHPNGSYRFSYTTGDGTSVTEEGEQKRLTGGGEEGASKRGGYTFRPPGGGEVSVLWTADERGFRPRLNFKPPGIASLNKAQVAGEAESQHEEETEESRK